MKINYLIYDGVTILDLVGPLQVWNNFPGVEANFVAASAQPVTADSGLVVTPDQTFVEAAAGPDILFVPGGVKGTAAAASDSATLDWLSAQGDQAGWVTSVCTGALILGAAGLLQGYKAATHWAAMEYLPRFGAVPVDERFVIDRNRATGGGVTAGIDFGLAMMSTIADESLARLTQLALEYTPAPPFKSGHPSEASAETLALASKRYSGLSELFGSIEMKKAAA